MVRARGVQAQLPASKNKEYNDVMVHVAQFNDEMVHVRGVWRSNIPNLKWTIFRTWILAQLYHSKKDEIASDDPMNYPQQILYNPKHDQT